MMTWLRFCAVFFTVAHIFSYNVVQSQTSISSTQYSLQKIVNDLVNHENRVKSAIAAALVKVDTAASEIKGNAADLSTALKNVKDFLVTVSTVNDYGQPNITLSCENVPVISASIRFYIQNCYDTNGRAVNNATSLMFQYGILNTAFIRNNKSLSDSQKQKVQAVLTALVLTNDEYIQYEVSLLTAVVQYTTTTTALTYCKNTICSCPMKMSATSNETFATVDSTIASVQQCVSNWESKIRNVSSATIALIASFNPGLKAKSDLLQIATTLDTISTFLQGYLRLNTYEAVNQTRNCDDAALKIALIQFKLAQYFKTNIEAATNATFILGQLGLLNTNAFAKSSELTDSQKKNIQSVVMSINALLEVFRQYSFSLSTGWVRFYQIFLQAIGASDESCVCKATGGGGGSTMKPTVTAITSS